MNRLLVATACGAVLLAPGWLFAWGPMGHSIVGQVASRRLSSTARKETKRLLGGKTLAQVSSWADEIRDERPETYNWHFADVPKNATGYKAERDCKLDPQKGDCIVAAIERSKKTLADRTQSDTDRAEAVMFLVHFLGDAHQPLHCADNHDAGGHIYVKFFGQGSNLHSVWDSGILWKGGLTEGTYTKHANDWLAAHDAKALAGGTTVDWVNECHKVAQDHAYGDLPHDKKLDQDYVDRELPIVEQQIATAGVRLARVLNEALKAPPH
jgi:hypothetical protein